MPHATAAILSIGDELTLGQTLDTNSRWLSEELFKLGIRVVEHITIPDDVALHVRTLQRLGTQVDLIISSGGLGPTADDLTRQAVAQASHDRLEEDPQSLAQIKSFFAARRRIMPPLNSVQALRPSRGSAIPNPHGTAPGIYAAIGAADCFCAPGPPSELQPMFLREIAPRLQPPAEITIRTRVMGTVGLGESDIATRLGPLMDRDRTPLVGTTASGGIVSCRLRYEGHLDAAKADELLDSTEREIATFLSPHVFSNQHNSLAAANIDALTVKGLTISVVESCTGGLLGAALSDVPGASSAFLGGMLTYSDELKTTLAGVPHSLLKSDEHPHAPGAVSMETSLSMALGGLRITHADLCISITGIAGPGGGSDAKPVGTVWITLARRTDGTSGGHPQADTRRFLFPGNRQTVRTNTVTAALAMLWLHLQTRPDIHLPRQTFPG